MGRSGFTFPLRAWLTLVDVESIICIHPLCPWVPADIRRPQRSSNELWDVQ